VTRYPKIRERHAPAIAGRLVNKLRGLPDMVDRLGLARIIGLAENALRYRPVKRIEIIGTGKADQTHYRVAQFRPQPARIERQASGIVSPGRMPGQHQALRITTITGSIVADPAHCRRAIFKKCGIFDFRHQPIIRHHDQITQCRQRPRGKAIVRATPRIPGATIKEHHNWKGCLTALAWPVQVEFPARARTIAQSAGNASRCPVLGDQ